ncbi:MAG: glycerophosphodiester phosphodiesterase [Nocardioidaceae bacterium]|nr:glycerophosphodiester phosphodiesterase [Nocardioidaceae bacterium]
MTISRSRVRRRAALLLATTLTTATTLSLVPAATSLAAPAQPNRTAAAASHDSPDRPLVIGHRGASGYRPEHTLESYQLAIRLGADYIEPDLVSTKNGVLVARHENEISTTTDVADHPEFADRHTTKTIDGVSVTGWFTEDFTLRELKTLRAVERLPGVRPGNTRYDGRFQVPTFRQVLKLAVSASERTGRTIGVAPETKHPTYFDSIGLSLEEPLLRALRRAGLNRRRSEVLVQSFEVSNIRQFARRSRVGILQLIGSSGAPYDFVESGKPRTYEDMVTPRGLRRIARYADVLGPDKNVLIPRDANSYLLEPTDVVDDAHAAGLEVMPYTFRDENQFLPADFRVGGDPNAKGDAFGEYKVFFGIGIDGVFADMPDTALNAAEWWAAGELRRPAA